MRRIRDLAVDITPLRDSRDFRLLFAGTAISQFGSRLTAVAIPFQLYAITGSTFAIGLFGALAFLPLLALNVVGGAVADKVERRRLIVGSQLIGAVAAVGLAVNASLASPSLVVVYALGILDIAAFAVGAPAERSSIIRVIEQHQVTSAMALKAVSGSTANVVGPALAGIALVWFGTAGTYLVDLATFLVAAALIGTMSRLPPLAEVDHPTARLLVEGLRHLRRQPILLGAFASDFNAMIFGLPIALFPAVAATRFPDAPEAIGLLYAAPFVGSLLASAASGWSRNLRRHGAVVVYSVIAWGVAMTGFGLVDGLWWSLVALAVGGAADMISGISRQAILQLASPPDLVGRMEGVGMAVWTSGPRLGELESGVVAGLTTVDTAIVTGGVACVAGMVLLARWLPGFAHYVAPGHDTDGDAAVVASPA